MSNRKKNKNLVFNKGPRRETVEYAGAKFTMRGLTYREFLYISGLPKYEADALTLRLALVDAVNLEVVDDDGNKDKIELEWTEIDIDGKATKALTEDSFELFDGSILLIGQLLQVVIELSQLTKEEAQTARIFRGK